MSVAAAPALSAPAVAPVASKTRRWLRRYGLPALGALVIVVGHDLGLAARFADQVLVLSEGRLVAQGGPLEALSEKVLSDVFRVGAFRAAYQGGTVIVPWTGNEDAR